MRSPSSIRGAGRAARRSPLTAGIVLALILAGAGARAEEAAPADVTAARLRFQQGVERFHDGDFTRALVEFRASFELNPLPQVLFNVGVTQYELGQHAEALETLHRYLAQGDQEPEERLDTARGLVAELEGLFGVLTVTANPAGAELTLDGAPQGRTPIERWLSPGSHELELSHHGFAPHRQTLELQAGQALELSLELTRLRRPWYRRWWVWTIVGAVAAGTATGLAVGLTREDQGTTVEVSIERGDGP